MYTLSGAKGYTKWHMPSSAKVLTVAYDASEQDPVLFMQEDVSPTATEVRTFYTQATGDEFDWETFDFSNLVYVGTAMQPAGVDTDIQPGLHVYEVVGIELAGTVSE